MQTYELVLSDDIVHDYNSVCIGISENYSKFIEELNAKFKILRQMPRMYQRIYYEKKTRTDYRRIVYKKYIVIYKICQNQITVLRIVSEKQNYLRSRFLKSL